MLNTIYQLTAPRRFELLVKDEQLREDTVIVRPTHLSICNADQRYYQGTRGAHILAQKLPMALIHESIGEVVVDNTGTYAAGTPVVMIPNLWFEKHSVIAENYLRSSKFRASSEDGFMQELVFTNTDRIVPLPQGIDKDVAAFTELVSVATHAITRFDAIAHSERSHIGIWGDGNVGFIVAVQLKKRFPESKIIVFGRNQDKLADFTFADATYLTSEIPDDLILSHVFECAGGQGSEHAIDQAIDHIQPEGTIALLGVSENPVPINTRMVLEKGLRVFGSSRSGRADFQQTLDLYEQHPEIVAYLSCIVGQTFEVRNVADMTHAFEMDIQKRLGKTVMHWQV
ncbi:MAG: zinc-binding dehydrogenase [Eggerthellaceae bacterium]|nr:zinc-binding dehydrogenase [Eggerthellaceae bacterium]